MDRRELVKGLGVLGAATFAACATHAQATGHTMGHHPPSSPLTPQQRAVVDSTNRCRAAGNICLAHCTDNLSAGDSHMADCQRAVMNMLAVVSAMNSVAAYRSAAPENIKALARTCAAYCRACEAACQPHVDHHDECRECAQACAECAKACDALAA